MFIISLLFLFPQDSIKTNSQSKLKDTVIVVNEGTQKIFIDNNPSFLERYQTLIGAFLGSLLAAIIALFSIWRTYKNQKKLNDEVHEKQIQLEIQKLTYTESRNKDHYRGILITIRSILISHKYVIDELKKELSSLIDDFKNHGRLAYEKPHTFIPIDLLKKLLIKLIEYEDYNIRILFSLSGYIISVDNLYNDLDFQSIVRLKNEFKFHEMVENYFERLNGRLSTLNVKSGEIENWIEKEINSLFGTEKDPNEKEGNSHKTD